MVGFGIQKTNRASLLFTYTVLTLEFCAESEKATQLRKRQTMMLV